MERVFRSSRSPETFSSGLHARSFFRRCPAFVGLWLVMLALSPAGAQEVIADRESPLYYEFVAVAGLDLTSQKDVEIVGSLHANGSVQLQQATRVEGDVSAVGTVATQGTITGTVTEGAAPRVLPTLPGEAAMRALADQVFEGDQSFIDRVIDDVVFVDGDVELVGQVSGRGSLLATGTISIKKGTGIVLSGASRLSLIALENIFIDKERHFRGVLRAGEAIRFAKATVFEGVAIADGTLQIHKDSRLERLELDATPPQITLLVPTDGAELDVSPTEIVAAWSDDFAGVDPATASILLDGIDRTAEAAATPDGMTLALIEALAEGPHTIEITVADFAGRVGQGSFGFVIVDSGPDVEPPELVITAPADGAQLDVAPTTIELAFSDAGSGIDPSSLRMVLDGVDLSAACDPTATGASCAMFAVPLGAHQVTAEVGDQAGNRTTAMAEFTIVQPAEPPVIEILAPAADTGTNALSLTVIGRVFTTGSITALDVNGQPATLVGDRFEVEVPVAEGFFPIVVRAVDGDGLERIEQVSIEVDHTAPELTLEQPQDESLSNVAEVRLVGAVSDASGFAELTLDGLPVALDPIAFDTVAALADGANSLTLVARDRFGNETTRVLGVRYEPALAVTITEPVDQLQAAADTVTVRGTVDAAATEVTVAGQSATLSGGVFSADVPLVLGSNPIAVLAHAADGRVGKAVVTVLRDSAPPRVVFTAPADGQVVAEPTVDVAGLINDIIGTVAPASEPFAVTVKGAPAEVAGDSFALAGVALQPGDNLLTAVVLDATGNRGEATISVRFDAAPAARLLRVSGSGQAGSIGSALSAPLVVQAVDEGGAPVASVAVVFRVVEGNGALTGAERQAVVFTDAGGLASIDFVVGTRAGTGNHVVEATAVGYAGTARFFADAVPGAVAHVVVDTGTQQLGITGQRLPEPLVALAVDEAFNPIAGVPVTFEVVDGGGRFENGEPTFEVITDAKGQAITAWILGPQEGRSNNVALATLGPADAPPVDPPSTAFAASAMAIGTGPTTIRGVVLDNTDQPVPGVTLKIAGTSLETTADSEGIFVLDNTPDGTIHLDVEGETATRPGVWPHLEFIFQAIPGRDNELPRPIYLLPLDTDGVFVSETEGGTLRLPEMPGFELEVAPGSATFPDGSRSGVVSVTVVHSDKVPMIPSFFQQPRLVITVQPSGTLFDPPARLTLPNVDGHDPGEVVDFFSFDHDLVRFVSIGPAQVTEDGSAVRSKLGFGIVEGGWHCGNAPSGTGTPYKCPKCEECNKNTKKCDDLPLCRGCDDPNQDEGKVCDGNGNCVPALSIMSRICNQIGLESNGPRQITRSDLPARFPCSASSCFAGIRLDFTKVTHMCNGADFKGAGYGETSFSLVGGTCPDAIKQALRPNTGPGGKVIKGNRLESSRGPNVTPGDIKSVCGPPQTSLSGPCTAIYEGDIVVGPCTVETRRITYTVGPSCSDFAVQ